MSGPTPLIDKIDDIVTEVIDNAEDISATYMYSMAPDIDDGSWILKVRSRREVDRVRQKFAHVVSLEDVTPLLTELITDEPSPTSVASVNSFVATILVKLKERTGFDWDAQLLQFGLGYVGALSQPWILSHQAEAILGGEPPHATGVPTSRLQRKADELVTQALADTDVLYHDVPQSPGCYLSLRHRDEFGTKSTALVALDSWFPTFELGAAVLIEMSKRTGQPWEGRFVEVKARQSDWIPAAVAEGHLNTLRHKRAVEEFDQAVAGFQSGEVTAETLNSSMATKAFEQAIESVKDPRTPRRFRTHGAHDDVWRSA